MINIRFMHWFLILWETDVQFPENTSGFSYYSQIRILSLMYKYKKTCGLVYTLKNYKKIRFSRKAQGLGGFRGLDNRPIIYLSNLSQVYSVIAAPNLWAFLPIFLSNGIFFKRKNCQINILLNKPSHCDMLISNQY